MAACATCPHVAPLNPPPAPLSQIRRAFRARWNHLAFSVDSGAGDWTLQVQDSSRNETLYTARRAGPRAAQLAAAEFAVLSVLGPASTLSPDSLARQLHWQEHY